MIAVVLTLAVIPTTAIAKIPTYTRHQPETTTLYKLVQQNWLTFRQQVELDTGYPLPDFVIKEFDEYLRCGILAHGFLRAKCEHCDFEMLVAFSCKRRGFCPSCGARRMSESAAHLVDCVLPMKPIRQWVLTFPVPIRQCLAVRPKIMARCLEIAHTAIAQYYRERANDSGAALTAKNAKAGAVTLIQRFGGSLNVNIHFHQLFIDGTYELDSDKQPVNFWVAGLPKLSEIEQVLSTIITRVIRYLQRQGIIIKDDDDGVFQLGISDEDVFSRLQASSAVYRFATGKSKGKKAIVLKTVDDGDHNSSSGLVAKNSGFSLHAGVATKADERDKLERICRYIARPAVAESRLSVSDSGDVVYRFKKPWDDGTAAIKLTPLELMERLAALVPRPRVHLTRFHGVLGPHYKYRKQIVPKPLLQPADAAAAATENTGTAKDPEKKQYRMSWARLLKRVFKIDVQTCTKCGHDVRIIAAIEDPAVICKILNHLGLPTRAPAPYPARGPPQQSLLEVNTTEILQTHPLFDEVHE